MSKSPGDGLLNPHQDWSIVDERVHRSYNAWVPLVDTDPSNGGLHVWPGSHRLVPDVRGPNLPGALAPLSESLWPRLEALVVEEGHAVIYDHGLLHGSPVNGSSAVRLTVVAGIVPREAPLRFYHRRGDELEVYQADVAFYLEGNPVEGPGDLTRLDRSPLVTSQLDGPALDRLAADRASLPLA